MEPRVRARATHDDAGSPSALTAGELARAGAPQPRALARRLAVLLELLEDDSPVVLEGVRRELVRLGRPARSALARAVRQGPTCQRARARRLLLEHGRLRALGRLRAFAAREAHDLETGLFLLSRFLTPGEDLGPHKRALDAFATEVCRRLRGRPPGVERALVLVDHLAGDVGFAGPENDYHHPDNIHLGRAIERRQGIPLTLCAIHAFVARRAGLDAQLLPVPGHVLLRVCEGRERVIVDPFHGGKLLTMADCARYLAQHQLPYRGEWFEPAADTAMLARHLLNAIASAKERRLHDQVRQLSGVHRLLACGPERRGPRP